MLRLEEDAALRRAFIDGEMTIYNSAQLKALLLPLLTDTKPVEVDLSGVSEIDSAGIQLLIAAKKTCQQKGMEIRLVEHSDVVVEAFVLMDLVSYFNDPIVLLASQFKQENEDA